MNKLVIGILAHVDAGKTTLAESILYQTGSIRKLGRVDHKDAFLDTYELERDRGITIFSKQAEFTLGDRGVTLLDTPGHVDFSAEMERTLQVLDYAVLVISGADGVQGHVETLWRLLKRYEIPVFLFINKMDQAGTDRDLLMEELSKRLDDRCLEFSGDSDAALLQENLAMCDEGLLERYLDGGTIGTEDIAGLVEKRKVFPCYFGSALKMQGVEEFLRGLALYTRCPDYPEGFGAKIYKISRDQQGTRLTHLKVTGGVLKVKMPLTNAQSQSVETSEEIWEEKPDQIRIYSGSGFGTVGEAPAGTICAVTGLSKTYSGQGLGLEAASDMPVLEPVLTYRIQLPEGVDVHQMLLKLRQLEEEEPQLHIIWDDELGEIHAQMMGEVQIEILKNMIRERFGVDVEFGSGNIVYKETIQNTVEGVGHFEPLRHYAEVHLLLEPGERGSGLEFHSSCSEDILDKNWQRLVMTHLEEKKHRGVLTGSEITDLKITLTAGRAHIKHTEGGDFRQATYRAVRQGLMQAKSLLLEPVYEYRLEIPSEMVGRGIADVQRMYGTFSEPRLEGEFAILTGSAPVVNMRDYQTQVIAYTRGRGRLFCTLKGYEPCHNAEEVIAERGYDQEKDLENPTGSVFCSHGAGFVVPWDKVRDYMHVESGIKLEDPQEESGQLFSPSETRAGWSDGQEMDKELQEIFERTYGTVERKRSGFTKTIHAESGVGRGSRPVKKSQEKEYLLVDGYNIIFAWEELKELADADLSSARTKLMDILTNYQGYKKNILILVFDAYKVEGNKGEVLDYGNIHVVYTKEAETADQYIERTVHEIGHKYQVTVATSDALEQMIIMGQGAIRMSAQGLKEEIQAANIEIRGNYLNKHKNSKNYLFDHLPEDMVDYMEDVRLGKDKLNKNEKQKD
ncbi:MAG TPA: TetM/TetW/TetO/TetS family tetracycline resistance ribosomal protection protein [Candidatus Pelethocola excrementipullorum]|nr:TetM/TetW/TetO/TetS family tetracycline resistance ribosomal protection protein [Candidatus Pelethocola excrementipullorum]